MSDPTLQRIWDAREAIARRCDYDIRKIVRYHQERQKADKRAKIWKRDITADTTSSKSASAKPRRSRKPDPTLQRIWEAREAIARKCDYDSHKLSNYCRERQKVGERTRKSKQKIAVVMSVAILKRKLNSVGKQAFVEHFYLFQKHASGAISRKQAIYELVKHRVSNEAGAGRRVGSAKLIFDAKKEIDALSIVLEAKRIPASVIAAAKDIKRLSIR